MKHPFILYHWSPASNRRRIHRHGLRPGRLSRDREWKAPYICFSDSPSHAWGLSAALSDVRQMWDLWMVWSTELKNLTRKAWSATSRRPPAEWRTTSGVRGSRIWYVGSRLRVPKVSAKVEGLYSFVYVEETNEITEDQMQAVQQSLEHSSSHYFLTSHP